MQNITSYRDRLAQGAEDLRFVVSRLETLVEAWSAQTGQAGGANYEGLINNPATTLEEKGGIDTSSWNNMISAANAILVVYNANSAPIIGWAEIAPTLTVE